MATPYPGRTGDAWDLGAGHSLNWTLGDGGVPLLLTERHPYGPSGGWHGFDIACTLGVVAGGGPGNEALLAIGIPLTCPSCGIRGRIAAGQWTPGT